MATDRRSNRQSLNAILAELKRRLSEIYDLNAAKSILTWDEATYMPKGGAVARGRQAALLKRLEHERSVDPALGRLIDRLESQVDKLSADDASLIRIARRDFERASKVPAEYVARMNAHSSASYNAWVLARPANDFAAMIPFLEETLELSREYASFFAPYEHIADPMIDEADEGMTTAKLQCLCGALSPRRTKSASACRSLRRWATTSNAGGSIRPAILSARGSPGEMYGSPRG
jgi:carboxypeptidase Taq